MLFCFGVPFPSVLVLQDKQLGDVFLVSSIVQAQRGNVFALAPVLMGIDWTETAYIYMHFVRDLLRATPPVTFEVNASRQGQKRPNKEETTATQNIITEVVYLVCYGRANIISTLLIF